VRRADRLFQIIQLLRSTRRPITAERLAEELEVAVRTVYRDVADLMARRVPIRGEAGVGYVLDASYDMPPLMLTPDEIEAAVLGAQWVAARGDPALVRGATHLIQKIAAVVPASLRPITTDESLVYPAVGERTEDTIDMERVRESIRSRRKLSLQYRNEQGELSTRVIWPLAVAYFDAVRLIVAWCELKQAFRHFRTDRILASDFLNERIPISRRALLSQWHQMRGD
jgi:predicted DNA-binding transcriptional regulator YafY